MNNQNKRISNLLHSYKYVSDSNDVSTVNINSSINALIKQVWNKCGTTPWEEVMNIELSEQPTVKEAVFLINEYLNYNNHLK